MRSVGLGLILGVMLNVGLGLGIFSAWQERLSDQLFIDRAPVAPVVLVGIDDWSIGEIGRWPWDRDVHAQLISKLITQNSKPIAIGYDVTFSEPAAGDGELQRALKAAGNVVLAEEERVKPLQIFRDVARMGRADVIVGRDGVVRETVTDGLAATILEITNSKKQTNLKSQNSKIRINYVGKAGSFTGYSFVDVLEGRVKAEAVADKIVLVGATAKDLHDTHVTPVGVMSGIEVHANTLETLWTGRELVEESRWMTAAVVVGLTLGLTLVMTRLRMLWVGMVAVVGLAGYFGYALWSFDQGTIRNLIYPPLGILGSAVASLGYKYVTESQRKRWLKRAMGLYLSPQVMETVLARPDGLKLGGERREVSVLFSDIAGFTTIAEKLKPEKLTELLNLYLTEMTAIVFEESGVVDKYIGDAVMAFWGAPLPQEDHAVRAVRTAVKMQEQVEMLRLDWQQAGVDLQIRIGISTGQVVVGNVGSAMRFDYSLVGDTVNLGSRLEGINKEYGTKIIISELTNNQLTNNQLTTRLLDKVAVKGKTKGIRIYEVTKLRIEGFEAARREYERGEFKRALGAFKRLNKQYPDDGPTQTYIKRCEELVQHPPKDWDGVFRPTEK